MYLASPRSFTFIVGALLLSCGSGGDRSPDADREATPPPASDVPTVRPPLVASPAAAKCNDPAQVYAEGKAQGWICPADAPGAGLTIVDLTDQWTPRPFAKAPDGTAPTFRENYLKLAAENSPDGDELEPEEQFVELYGVVPNLSTVLRRLDDDVRHACHEAIPPMPLVAFTRSVSQSNDAAIRAGDRRRQWLTQKLEKERVRRKLPDLDALVRVPSLRQPLADLRRLTAVHDALVTVQAHMVCDGVLTQRYVDGLFTWRTGYALDLYQRKNFLVPNARLDDETRAALLAGSRELTWRGALRALRERVVDATGLIEDGTAGAGPIPVLGRQLDPTIMRAAKGYRPMPHAAPDRIGEATEIAARALGWTDADRTRSWLLANHVRGAGLHVAIALPPPPAYYSAHMDLSAEIDRGDVWYDDRPIPRVAARRPAMVLYTMHGGQRIPLVRWPTTIGSWSDQRLPSGRVVQKWKESEVGKRVWRDMYAAPVWYPPKTTPDRDLVKYLWNGKWRLKREIMGPGPRSAYGMVMLMHHQEVKVRQRVRFDDHGIRVHGSSSVTSIAHGNSHGCHRLFNHLAVRLGGFVLAHRAHERKGEDVQPYRRIVNYRGRFEARLPSRGFLYQLTPPVPIEVLPGRIKSARKVPPRNSAPARP